MTTLHRVEAGRAVAALAVLALVTASCGGGEAPSSSAGPSTTVTQRPAPATQPASPGTTSNTAATPLAATCPSSGYPHLAPDLEALLPASVGGRDLAIWSNRGDCWLKQATITLDNLAAAGVDVEGIDVDHLVYAVAGRSNVQKDPPYFVTVLWKPPDDREALAALALYGGVLGFKDLNQFLDSGSYEELEVGGKSVLVGDVEMIVQDEHLQGAPYLYETDDYVYVVLTTDPAWAEEAVSKLPG